VGAGAAKVPTASTTVSPSAGLALGTILTLPSRSGAPE
jgi:hypothetical protein